MPKYLFFYLLIILSVPLSASHIIGGDITLKHIKGTDYELKMNLFFDLVYGSTSALEEQAAIVFFDKTTNIPFQSFSLPITGFVDINPSKDNFSLTIGTMLNFVVSATSGNLHTIYLKSDGTVQELNLYRSQVEKLYHQPFIFNLHV